MNFLYFEQFWSFVEPHVRRKVASFFSQENPDFEDAVQLTMEKLWELWEAERIDLTRHPWALVKYATNVARTKCLDLLRERKNSALPSGLDLPAREVESGSLSISELLPERLREFWEALLHRNSVREVCEHLGISRRQYYNLLEELRAVLRFLEDSGELHQSAE